jgi:hypothetical protein
MSKFFRLEGKIPVPCDLDYFARNFDEPDRHVADEMVNDVRVSTVFLGIDHNFRSSGPPLVFETLCFYADGKTSPCYRFSTWEEAEKFHHSIVNDLKKTHLLKALGSTPKIKKD